MRGCLAGPCAVSMVVAAFIAIVCWVHGVSGPLIDGLGAYGIGGIVMVVIFLRNALK